MKIVYFSDCTGTSGNVPIRKEKDGFTLCYRGNLLERIAFVLTGRMYLRMRKDSIPTIGLTYEKEI